MPSPSGTNAPICIIVQNIQKKSVADSYNGNSSTLIGKIHLLCGALFLFTGVCLIINFDPSNHPYYLVYAETIGAGIWCSVFFFICGYLGMVTAKKKNSRWIILTMVAGILSAISSGLLIIGSAFALYEDMCGTDGYLSCNKAVSTGFNVFQLIIGITELMLAIMSSIISCRATCCRKRMDKSTNSKFLFSHRGKLDQDQIISLLESKISGRDAEADDDVRAGPHGDLPSYSDLDTEEVENEEGSYAKITL